MSIDRKITKIGNSYGVTLPIDLLKQANLQFGEDVEIEVVNGEIIIRKNQKVKLPSGVDTEFLEMLNDVVREHDEAFKGLVDK